MTQARSRDIYDVKVLYPEVVEELKTLGEVARKI